MVKLKLSSKQGRGKAPEDLEKKRQLSMESFVERPTEKYTLVCMGGP